MQKRKSPAFVMTNEPITYDMHAKEQAMHSRKAPVTTKIKGTKRAGDVGGSTTNRHHTQ